MVILNNEVPHIILVYLVNFNQVLMLKFVLLELIDDLNRCRVGFTQRLNASSFFVEPAYYSKQVFWGLGPLHVGHFIFLLERVHAAEGNFL